MGTIATELRQKVAVLAGLVKTPYLTIRAGSGDFYVRWLTLNLQNDPSDQDQIDVN